MPNYCCNRMTITGPEADVAAFVDLAIGPGLVYPAVSPGELEHERMDRDWAKLSGKPWPPPRNPPSPLDFHKLVPIPDAIIARGYTDAGYEAERDLWGCKWGAFKVTVERFPDVPGKVAYQHDTTWGPARPFLVAVSERFPTLTFCVSWSEEYPTRGRLHVQNGILTKLEALVEGPYDFERTEAEIEDDPPGTFDARRKVVMKMWQDAHDLWVDLLDKPVMTANVTRSLQAMGMQANFHDDDNEPFECDDDVE